MFLRKINYSYDEWFADGDNRAPHPGQRKQSGNATGKVFGLYEVASSTRYPASQLAGITDTGYRDFQGSIFTDSWDRSLLAVDQVYGLRSKLFYPINRLDEIVETAIKNLIEEGVSFEPFWTLLVSQTRTCAVFRDDKAAVEFQLRMPHGDL